MKKSILALLIFIQLITLSCRNSSVNRANSYNNKWVSLLNEAKQENKYVIVSFFTEWCAPCKILEAKVFQDDSVSKFLTQKSIFLSLDAEKKFGLALAMKYSITRYPTILIFNPKETLVYEKTGIDGIETPESFCETIGKVLAGNNILPAKGLKPSLIVSYPDFYNQHFLSNKEPDSAILINYFKEQSDLFSEVNWAVIRVFGNDKHLEEFIIKNANKYIDLYGYMVKNLIQEKIRSTLSNDYKTKDSTQFKKDIKSFFKLKTTLSSTERQKRLSLAKLYFWAKTDLNWNSFLLSWNEYRSSYGNDLDLESAKLIDEYCHDQKIRDLAETILKKRIKQNDHDWRGIVTLANLLKKNEAESIYYRASVSINSDLIQNRAQSFTDILYEKAIKYADGNESVISEIVYMRIQSADFATNEKVWWDAMSFYQKHLPKEYKKYYKFHTMAYYNKQKRWPKFIHYVNAYCEQLGGFEKIHKTNAHTFSMCADAILHNSEDTDQIKIAISWTNGLIRNNKNDPDIAHFIQIKEGLQDKLKTLYN